MYSLQKGSKATKTLYVHTAERLNSSVDGNPQYRIYFCYEKDSTLSDFSAVADANARWMYRLPEAHALEGKQCNVVLHRPRKNLYIDEMELV